MNAALPDRCIEWPGTRDRDGYGCLAVAGERRAHRAIYRMFVGPIPDGMLVRHACDNPPCVNPAHLLLGTPRENTADRIARGRVLRGVASPSAKLDASAVRAIRAREISQHEAQAKYGIRRSSFYRVRSALTYVDD